MDYLYLVLLFSFYWSLFIQIIEELLTHITHGRFDSDNFDKVNTHDLVAFSNSIADKVLDLKHVFYCFKPFSKVSSYVKLTIIQVGVLAIPDPNSSNIKDATAVARFFKTYTVKVFRRV